MFYYARNISQYYLQLEDDVISEKSFVTSIRNYIKLRGSNWVTLQFSKLGFIGVLYKSEHLEKLARFLLLFYDEQPVDWLYKYFASILAFPKIYMRKPSLFKHMGEHSSFASKTDSQNKEILEKRKIRVDIKD